jgi:hypothetical protein
MPVNYFANVCKPFVLITVRRSKTNMQICAAKKLFLQWVSWPRDFTYVQHARCGEPLKTLNWYDTTGFLGRSVFSVYSSFHSNVSPRHVLRNISYGLSLISVPVFLGYITSDTGFHFHGPWSYSAVYHRRTKPCLRVQFDDTFKRWTWGNGTQPADLQWFICGPNRTHWIDSKI